MSELKTIIEENKLRDVINRLSKYDMQIDEYVFMCPKSKEDITDEAQQQCNCLAGYVERYTNGQSNIFFMRKYKDKETSYITIETSNEHELHQIYYARNRAVSEHDRKIAERWCEKCKKIDAGKLGPNGVSLKANENNKDKKEEAAS